MRKQILGYGLILLGVNIIALLVWNILANLLVTVVLIGITLIIEGTCMLIEGIINQESK